MATLVCDRDPGISDSSNEGKAPRFLAFLCVSSRSSPLDSKDFLCLEDAKDEKGDGLPDVFEARMGISLTDDNEDRED